MEDEKKKAIIETVKSAARGVWFGLLGLIVVALTAVATSGAVADVNLVVAGFTVNLSVVLIAVVGFIAKLIDTYIHKNKDLDSNGIAPAFLQK